MKKQRHSPREHRDAVKPLTDKWSAHPIVVNPVSIYFPTTGDCKVNRERWLKITFIHHKKEPSFDDFAQTALCFDYHVAGLCKLGMKCELNHRSRKRLIATKDETIRNNVRLVDNLINSLG